MVFLFPFVRTKEKETKRKSAGYAPELKNPHIFLNEKNSLTLKQLFVLNGKYSIFLHAPPLRPERPSPGGHIASLVVWMYTRSFTTLCSALDDK